MTETRTVTSAEQDETNTGEVVVRLGTLVEKASVAREEDAFSKSVSEIRKLGGLSPSIKRSATKTLNKFHRGSDGAKSKKNEIESVGTGYSIFDVVEPPYNQYYLAELYEKSSAHAAAIRAKVRNIVALGYDFIETDETKSTLDRAGGDQGKVDRIRRKLANGKQVLNDWIDACNEEDTFTETMIKVWTDYEATGNGYLEIGRTVNGDVGYIGHIPATTVRVRRNRDGFVQIISNRAVFFRNFGDKSTPDPITTDSNPNEIIHIKKYTPTHGYYGISDIIPALSAVAGNEFSARFNLDYFENKAVPRYVIIIKGATLSTQSELDILEFFQSSVKGKNHRTLYVPLPPDSGDEKVSFEMKPVENGIQDSSFNKYRGDNLNEILMAHGTPITKVSSGAGANIPLAAAKDFDKTFKEQVCQPEQAIFEKKLNRIIKEKTNVFKLKLNELSLTDEDTQSKIDERYLRLQTDMPNEVRARRGLPGITGGDKPVDLKPQQAAEARTQATGNRQRDQQRTANSTDSPSSTNPRNPQGEGRQQQ